MIQKSAELSFYKSSDNIFKIIFMMSYHTLIKYIIIKEHDFKIFMINYLSLFSDLFYHIIINKNYVF